MHGQVEYNQENFSLQNYKKYTDTKNLTKDNIVPKNAKNISMETKEFNEPGKT